MRILLFALMVPSLAVECPTGTTAVDAGCKGKLATVLANGHSSSCGITEGTLDIWVNTALAANEMYDMVTSTLTISDTLTANKIISRSTIQANAATATSLENRVNIGGIAFDGTQPISLPGVDTDGTMDTSGNAATATKLQTAVNIGGTPFDGTIHIVPNKCNTAGVADSLKSNVNMALGNDKTFTAGNLVAGNDLKAADGAFHVEINGYATQVDIRGFIRIYNSPTGYSIDASQAILSPSYWNPSDERIKKDIRALKDNESLDILRQLETKSYEYIDQIQRRSGKIIGFIAQDVNKTIPSAVTTLTKIIPNEMRLITVNFERKGIDSWEMTLNEVLSPGTYRFIFETFDDNEVAKDLTTEDGKIFYVEHQYKKEVLLYGKEIDDFLTIDKNKIFAVAYSALQQVDKNQIALQQKVASLEETIANLSERLAALDGQS
jgi:hypothetical protein